MLHCLVPASRLLEATGPGGLSGVRTVVKDCLSVAGHRSSFGHPRWRETHAAAMSDVNPHDPDCGGSCSGVRMP